MWTDLVLMFGWLQFRGFPLDTVVNSTTPGLLWRVGLAAYFASWIYGTKFDIDVQEHVYHEFPDRGKVPVHAIAVVLLLAIVAAILLWATENVQKFAVAISAFFIIDHLAWLYLIRLINPVVTSSRENYKKQNNYYLLEALEVVSHQIQGNWKLWRLTGGIPLVVLINAFSFYDIIQSYLVNKTLLLLPQLSAHDTNAFIAGILVVCFVAFMEIWSWSIRIKTKVSLVFIDEASLKYDLSPKNPS